MTDLRIDEEAQGWVERLADDLTHPADGECLCCYVARMLREFGCADTLRFAQHYRDVCAPRAVALERRLGDMGGYCDCEIFLNGMELAEQLCRYDEHDDRAWPAELPDCQGARRGSTKSCGNWVRQSRYGW